MKKASSRSRKPRAPRKKRGPMALVVFDEAGAHFEFDGVRYTLTPKALEAFAALERSAGGEASGSPAAEGDPRRDEATGRR